MLQLSPTNAVEGQQFGASVALGTWNLAVGAPSSSSGAAGGEVYLYSYFGASSAMETDVLSGPPGTQFGASGALFEGSGDAGTPETDPSATLVVGAPVGGTVAVYYTNSSARVNWRLTATLEAVPDAGESSFGKSVSIYVETIVSAKLRLQILIH